MSQWRTKAKEGDSIMFSEQGSKILMVHVERCQTGGTTLRVVAPSGWSITKGEGAGPLIELIQNRGPGG